MQAYTFFIGWFVLFLLFWGSTVFEGTRTLMYYILWLAIVLNLVVHYQEFQDIILSVVSTPSELGQPQAAQADQTGISSIYKIQLPTTPVVR